MTTEELIDLVFARDRLNKQWREASRKLEEQRIEDGFYIGNNGRCVRVTSRVDNPCEFTLVNLNTVLRYKR